MTDQELRLECVRLSISAGGNLAGDDITYVSFARELYDFVTEQLRAAEVPSHIAYANLTAGGTGGDK